MLCIHYFLIKGKKLFGRPNKIGELLTKGTGLRLIRYSYIY